MRIHAEAQLTTNCRSRETKSIHSESYFWVWESEKHQKVVKFGCISIFSSTSLAKQCSGVSRSSFNNPESQGQKYLFTSESSRAYPAFLLQTMAESSWNPTNQYNSFIDKNETQERRKMFNTQEKKRTRSSRIGVYCYTYLCRRRSWGKRGKIFTSKRHPKMPKYHSVQCRVECTRRRAQTDLFRSHCDCGHGHAFLRAAVLVSLLQWKWNA